jgi:predicted DsbA family dithiol-disulfide isomerase
MYSERFPDEDEPAVRWLPFQLNPDIPEHGVSRQAYIESKFGPGAKRNYARVAGIGQEVGIAFDFDAITVQPNTLEAHRLMAYGARNGREDETAESLFAAYFLEGAVLTDPKVLADIGERAGLERTALESYLASGEDREAVAQGDIQARQAGINGVPFFIFNRKVAVSGAHEPDTLLAAMIEALKT